MLHGLWRGVRTRKPNKDFFMVPHEKERDMTTEHRGYRTDGVYIYRPVV
jgi:hypothetical protein